MTIDNKENTKHWNIFIYFNFLFNGELVYFFYRNILITFLKNRVIIKVNVSMPSMWLSDLEMMVEVTRKKGAAKTIMSIERCFGTLRSQLQKEKKQINR